MHHPGSSASTRPWDPVIPCSLSSLSASRARLSPQGHRPPAPQLGGGTRQGCAPPTGPQGQAWFGKAPCAGGQLRGSCTGPQPKANFVLGERSKRMHRLVLPISRFVHAGRKGRAPPISRCVHAGRKSQARPSRGVSTPAGRVLGQELSDSPRTLELGCSPVQIQNPGFLLGDFI